MPQGHLVHKQRFTTFKRCAQRLNVYINLLWRTPCSAHPKSQGRREMSRGCMSRAVAVSRPCSMERSWEVRYLSQDLRDIVMQLRQLERELEKTPPVIRIMILGRAFICSSCSKNTPVHDDYYLNLGLGRAGHIAKCCHPANSCPGAGTICYLLIDVFSIHASLISTHRSTRMPPPVVLHRCAAIHAPGSFQEQNIAAGPWCIQRSVR